MKNLILQVNNATQAVAQHEVVTQDGKPTVIKATNKSNYQLIDQSTGLAPDHIITKRQGNDLHVSIEEGGKESDLVIEGYYEQADSALIGQAEDGSYYYYVPDTGEVSDFVTELAPGDIEGQALGGNAQPTPYWVGAAEAEGGFAWLPWLAGLAGVGLVAAALADDDDDDDNNSSQPEPTPETPELEAEITINDITEDNIINAVEAGETIAVTGTVGGDVKEGDTVTLTVNNKEYTGEVDANNTYSIEVPGSDLAADSTVEATVTATDDAGNTKTAETTKDYGVDVDIEAEITINDITEDNIINAEEAGETIAVTGTVGGDVKEGDTVTLTVNGEKYTGTVDANNTYSIEVPGSELAKDTNVSASVTTTDEAGNIATATAERPYTVTDSTDPTDEESPVFTEDSVDQEVEYSENQEADAVLAKVEATDNVAVTGYEIVGGNDDGYFQIDSEGNITLTEAGLVAAANDFETTPNEFELTVQAADEAGNTADTTVTLNVGNVDDTPPIVEDQAFSYIENQEAGYTVGKVVAEDDTADITSGIAGYEITSGNDNGYFEIDAEGNITLTEAGKEAAANDFETDPNEFNLEVTVTDGEGNSTLGQVTINVTDIGSPGAHFYCGFDLTLSDIQTSADKENVAKLGNLKVTYPEDMPNTTSVEVTYTSVVVDDEGNESDLTKSVTATKTVNENSEVIWTISENEDNVTVNEETGEIFIPRAVMKETSEVKVIAKDDSNSDAVITSDETTVVVPTYLEFYQIDKSEQVTTAVNTSEDDEDSKNTTTDASDIVYVQEDIQGSQTYLDTGDGNDCVLVGDEVRDGATVVLGAGDDKLNVSGFVTNNSFIDAGEGNDKVKVGTNITNSSVELGEGNNDLFVGLDINNSSIKGGSGDDTVIVAEDIEGGATVDLGDGNNKVVLGNPDSVDGYFDNATYIGGTGEDELTTRDDLQNATVTLGDGENSVNVGYMYQDTNNSEVELVESNEGLDVSLINSKVYGGNDDDVINVIGSIKSNSYIDLDDGNNEVYVGLDINKSKIFAGEGDDTLIVNEDVEGNSIINLGDGNNKVILGNADSADGYFDTATYTGGSGSDELTLRDDLQNATVTLGDGQNTVNVGYMYETDIEGNDVLVRANEPNTWIKNTTISGGKDSDIINVKDSIDAESKIDLMDGDNSVTVGTFISGGSSLSMGSGNDELNVGTNLASSTVNLGDGTNNVTVGLDINNSTVTGGEGDDTIIVADDIEGGSVIDLGDGNNKVVLGNVDSADGYFAGSSYLGGNGSDIVTTRDSVRDDSTIDLGNGDNELNVGYIYQDGILINSNADSDMSIISSEVIGGDGADTINVVDNIQNSTIDLGAGDDTINVGALKGDNTIDGGEGYDTLTLTLEDVTGQNLDIANFEEVNLASNSEYTIDADNFTTGTDGTYINGTGATTLNLQGFTAGETGVAGNETVGADNTYNIYTNSNGDELFVNADITPVM